MPEISFSKWLGAAAIVGAGFALASQSCSILVQSGRCSKDADCKPNAGESAICSQGACIASGALTDSGAGDASTDSSDALVGECQTNEECVGKIGEYSICEKSQLKCVKLLTADCTKVYGEYQNDNAIFIGTMFKQGSTVTDPGASPDALAAIELAFDEFKNARGGLPNPSGGPSRPLVAVECNQVQDAVRAAKHLTDVVRVPAIIGASTSYVTIQVATQVTIQGGVFLISPYASSPGLTTLEDKNLVWRTYPSDALQAVAIPTLVNEITATPNFTTPRKPGAAVKIGIVFKDDTYGQGLRDIILQSLKFNGKTAAENQSAGNLKLFSYPNTDDPALANYDFTPLTAEVISEATPFDILMMLGTAEVLSVFSYAESHWPSASPPPYYIMPDGVASTPKLAATMELLVGTDAAASKSLRKRIRGTIVNVFSGPLFDSFSLKFKGNAINGANAYDAAYVVAYGLYALGSEPLTGANLAQAMSKLHSPGTSVEVGGNGIATAIQALAGGNIEIKGVSGPMNFDLATGDVPANSAAVWCLGIDSQGKTRLVTQTGETFSASTNQMTGTFPDPPSGTDPCNFF